MRRRFSKKFDTGISKHLGENYEGVSNQHADPDHIIYQLDRTIKQLKVMGYRERTLYDYRYHIEKYIEVTKVSLLSEMDKDSLLLYINHNNVSQSTKLIRLKLMKALLNRWHNEGLIEFEFWKDINIRVDEDIKEGLTKRELGILLNHLDFSNFVELRDGCIFLLIWETGIRLGTVSRVTEDMVNFKNKLIHYTGESMKNRKRLSLPLSDDLLEMLRILMRVNKTVLKHNKLEPAQHYLFISSLGNPMDSRSFGKRVHRYKKLTGLKNINPHAIRCGFAKRLLYRGVNIAVISKALNHKSIDTTTKYLYIDNEEVIEAIRGIE